MKPYLLNKLRKRLRLSKQINNFLINTFPFTFFVPHMSDREFSLFEKYTRKGNHVLEYGAGGSTFYFIKRYKKITTIENNEPYYQYMKTLGTVKRNKRLNLQYIDTGKSLSWGRPADTEKKENWPLYYRKAWTDLHLPLPDVIFIDGRFRVMCALEAINYINSDTVVIIHDFSSREYYFDLLNYFELVDQMDALAILRKKPIIDLIRLEESRQLFSYDYR